MQKQRSDELKRRIREMVYHVAYFLSDWNYEIVNRFLTGVTLFQAEHPDTEVHVFDNPSKYGSLELDESAFAFFRLPDINNYAGMRAVVRHVIEDHGVKRPVLPEAAGGSKACRISFCRYRRYEIHQRQPRP